MSASKTENQAVAMITHCRHNLEQSDEKYFFIHKVSEIIIRFFLNMYLYWNGSNYNTNKFSILKNRHLMLHRKVYHYIQIEYISISKK